jgi:hypothetical protein
MYDVTELLVQYGMPNEISTFATVPALQPFRFLPKRLECMAGGPDSITWTRWEWQLDDDGVWTDPAALLSH